MIAISLYLAAIGVGACGLAAGLLIGGPLALDRKFDPPNRSRYATTDDAIDLHADRDLGDLEGGPDELWRPLATVHFWTLGLIYFGLTALLLTYFGTGQNLTIGVASGSAVSLAYLSAAFLRSLPEDGSS